MHYQTVTPFEHWMRENVYGKMAPSAEIKELLAMAFEGGQKALEQPAQEPVAWMGFDEIGNADFLEFNDFNKYTTKQTTVLKKPIPLYIHPHQWQGLTEDEIRNIDVDTRHFMVFARAIEAKLKEKNHE